MTDKPSDDWLSKPDRGEQDAGQAPPPGQQGWGAPPPPPGQQGWGAPPPATPGPPPPGQQGWGAPGGPPPPGQQGWTAPPAPPPPPQPGPVPVRPMALGDLLDGGFALLRSDFGTLLLVVGVVLVPTQLLLAFQQSDLQQFFMEQTPTDPAGAELALDTLSTQAPAFLGLLGVAVVAQLLTLLATGAVTHVSGARFLGRRAGPAEALRAAGRRALPLFGAALLALVPSVLVVSVVGGLVVLLVVLDQVGAAIAAGVVGFFAGGALLVWLYVAFALSVPAVMIEGAGPVTALRRSFRLVRGRWWRTLAILLLTFLIVGAVGFALSAVPSFAGGLLLALDPGSSLGPLLAAVGAILGGIITQPVAAIVTLLLYLDARIRAEGLDLQLASGEAEGLGALRTDGTSAG